MPAPRPRSRRRRGRRMRHEPVRLPTRRRAMSPRGVATRRARTGARPPRRRTIRPKYTRDLGRTRPRMRRASAPPRPRTRRARPRRPRRLASQLADDPFRLLARERAQRLGLLAAGCAELCDDLERDLVVGRLEHLDDVVAAERHPNADELPARLLDQPLAVLDAVAPRRQPGASLRRPAHERDVVRHGRAYLLSPCA